MEIIAKILQYILCLFVLVGLFGVVALAINVRHKLRYIPPSYLDDGRIYGYKALYWDGKCWRSPQQETAWYKKNGVWCLWSDRDPRYFKRSGVYISKTPDECYPYMDKRNSQLFLVTAEEPVVEQEGGYRAMGSYMLRSVPR